MLQNEIGARVGINKTARHAVQPKKKKLQLLKNLKQLPKSPHQKPPP